MSPGGRAHEVPGFEQGKRAAIALLTKEKQTLPPYAQIIVVGLIRKVELISDKREVSFR